MKLPFRTGWGRGGSADGKGAGYGVYGVGEVGSGAGCMTMSGGEFGDEGGVVGSSCCAIDGEVGEIGRRSVSCGVVGGCCDISYADGACAVLGYNSVDIGVREGSEDGASDTSVVTA
jgi:hypothetical protein